MRHKHATHFARGPAAAATALLTAIALGTGLASAAQVPAAATTTGHTTGASLTDNGASALHATAKCTKKANGHLASCASPVKANLLPAGVRDKSTVTQLVKDPADMVDTRTWTSAGGNTFPGADVPFGMVQWSPDTMPDRNAGGGYGYGDSELTGYSLTHLSGPGCGAAGDVPILPMTGGLPSDPNSYVTSFTNSGEVAQAGYYSAESNLPATITSQFAETPHSAMGRFTFPKTTKADFLIKLDDSQNGDINETAKIVGNDEVTGSVTSGDFCDETNNGGQNQLYTVHFSIVFSQPFTKAQVVTPTGSSSPDAAFVTFNTTSSRVVQAKVGISYVSTKNAQLNWQTENPGWNFDAVKGAAQLS
ncbi:MAG: hypothetical protein ACRDNF_10795, partial [Streptosporangiaceae bacterium]